MQGSCQHSNIHHGHKHWSLNVIWWYIPARTIHSCQRMSVLLSTSSYLVVLCQVYNLWKWKLYHHTWWPRGQLLSSYYAAWYLSLCLTRQVIFRCPRTPCSPSMLELFLFDPEKTSDAFHMFSSQGDFGQRMTAHDRTCVMTGTS
jgi:hypothetical protein